LVYPNGENCIYLIKAPINNKIVIKGAESFITDSKKAYVLIRDGKSVKSHLLGKYSGFINKFPVIESTGRYMFIQFIRF